MSKRARLILVLCILILPTFTLMLRMGIYTMHDFHVFRQQQFDKCIQNKTFPCRWAPDSGKGYGEPLFNFYGQFPYWIGEVFHVSGFSIIDSTKLLFILSLVASGVTMYFLAREFWGEAGGFLSGILYVYAPYRAVDVWVRGALNESLAFVLFPFIFYHFDKLLARYKPLNLIWLSLGVAALMTTHNLSVLMFAPFMLFWWVFRCLQNKSLKSFPSLAIAGVVALLLSAYYLIPVALESKYITISQTTQGYYDFRAHFSELRQIFISNFWGYGGSTWGPNDTLSLAIGYAQWIIPIVIAGVMLVKRKLDLNFLVLTTFGVMALFLTHNKSAPIWTHIPPMAYIQFPWRFLNMGVLFLALAGGALAQYLPKMLIPVVVLVPIFLTSSFYHPDIWRPVSDSQQFSGALWDEQRSSALQDFWPVFGTDQPTSFAPTRPMDILTTTDYVKIQYPIVYFPGWVATIDGKPTAIFPTSKLGLITLRAPLDYKHVSLKFVDTWPRTVGNCVSLVTLMGIGIWFFPKRHSLS